MTSPVGRPPTVPAPLTQKGHPLGDPLGFPLAFKQWVVDYVTQELQLQKVFGYQALPMLVTGVIPATGTTPTAGTGFTYTHAATGIFVFTVAPAFVSTPVVFAQTSVATTDANVVCSAVSSTGFTVRTFDSTGAVANLAFNFLALTVQ